MFCIEFSANNDKPLKRYYFRFTDEAPFRYREVLAHDIVDARDAIDAEYCYEWGMVVNNLTKPAPWRVV